MTQLDRAFVYSILEKIKDIGEYSIKVEARIEEVLSIVLKCYGVTGSFRFGYYGETGGEHCDGGSFVENFTKDSIEIYLHCDLPSARELPEEVSRLPTEWLYTSNDDIRKEVLARIAEEDAENERVRVAALKGKEKKKALKQAALSKLTNEERKALGIKVKA